MKNMTDTEYFINDGRLDHKIEKLANIKHLGVIFDSELSFWDHIQIKINKAYSILGLIKRNFIYMDKNTFIMLCYVIGKTTPWICQLAVVTIQKRWCWSYREGSEKSD